MTRVRAALPLALCMAGLSGCGGEEERLAPLEPNSPRVAMTVDYPGSAPLALITYRSGGRRCHALGTLTAHGPRALGAPRAPLDAELARRGACLDAEHPLVSVQQSPSDSRPMRVVGGLTRADVVRVRVAGQQVRPERGAFLVGWPAGTGSAGSVVEVTLRDGSRHRLPLEAPAA